MVLNCKTSDSNLRFYSAFHFKLMGMCCVNFSNQTRVALATRTATNARGVVKRNGSKSRRRIHHVLWTVKKIMNVHTLLSKQFTPIFFSHYSLFVRARVCVLLVVWFTIRYLLYALVLFTPLKYAFHYVCSHQKFTHYVKNV